MSTIVFNVNFGGSTGIIDIAALGWVFPQFEISDVCHNTTFQPIKNSGKFKIQDETGTFIGYMSNVSDNFIPAIFYVDGVVYFNGYIRNNFSGKFTDYSHDVSIELIDKSKDLERSLAVTISMENADICDTADPDNSILHQLLLGAGFGVPMAFGITGIDLAQNAFGITGIDTEENAYGILSANFDTLIDIPITLDYYFKSRFEDYNYYQLIQDLLKEAGYCLVINAEGNPVLKSLIYRSEAVTSGTTREFLIHKGFTLKRNNIRIDSFTGKYFEHETILKATVFNDTTGGNNVYDCLIEVATGEDYPTDAADPAVVTKLDFEVEDVVGAEDKDKGKVLILAKYAGAYLDIRPVAYFSAAKVWTEDLWYGTAVDNGAHNDSGVARTLIKFKVIADAIVQGPSQEYTATVAGLTVNNNETMDFEYVYDSAVIKQVVDGYLDNAVYGKYPYNFVTSYDLDLGGYYDIEDDVITNITYSMKIISKTPVWAWTKTDGLHVMSYKYGAISFDQVVSIDTEEIVSNPTAGRSGRSVFREATLAAEGLTNPTPPYELGDTWVKDDGNWDCTTRKDIGDAYAAGDWTKIETNAAYADAATALAALADMSDDDKITPVEKLNLNREWARIVEDAQEIIAQATAYGVSYTDYSNVGLTGYYDYLRTYLIGDEAPLPVTAGILTDLTTTSDIAHGTFNQKFADYYFGYAELSVDVADAIKAIADANETLLASPLLLGAIVKSPTDDDVFLHAIDHGGNNILDEDGKIMFGGVYKTVPYGAVTVADGTWYMFKETTGGTIQLAQYDFTDARFEVSGSAMTAGFFFAEVIAAGGLITSMEIYQTAKTEAEMVAHYKRLTMQILAAAAVGDFGAIATGLGIEAAFTSLAVYNAFIVDLIVQKFLATKVVGANTFLLYADIINGLKMKYGATGVEDTLFHVDINGDILLGDYVGGTGVMWDQSEGDLKVKGIVTAGAGSEIAYGDVTSTPDIPTTYRQTRTTVSSPVAGDTCYDTTTLAYYRYDGSAWVELSMSGFTYVGSGSVAFQTASGNVKIYDDGTIAAVDGIFSGKLIATEGVFGNITTEFLYKDATGTTYTTANDFEDVITFLYGYTDSLVSGSFTGTYGGKTYRAYERVEKYTVRTPNYNYTYYFYATDGTTLTQQLHDSLASDFNITAILNVTTVNSDMTVMGELTVANIYMPINQSLYFTTTYGTTLLKEATKLFAPSTTYVNDEALQSNCKGTVKFEITLNTGSTNKTSVYIQLLVDGVQVQEFSFGGLTVGVSETQSINLAVNQNEILSVGYKAGNLNSGTTSAFIKIYTNDSVIGATARVLAMADM